MDHENQQDEKILTTEPQPEELQDFDLDAIMQEFSQLSDEDLPDPQLSDEGLTDFQLPADLSSEDEAAMSGDTIRMDISSLPKGTYGGAQPIAEEEEDAFEEEEEITGQQSDEEFTDQWEPEYEQPMGEYIPPQPILFHPQSRLKELKRKLVAGPEKRYYELSEKGTGKLQALLFISLVVALLCIGATVLYAVGMVQEDRMRLMVFGQLLAMFLSALLGSFQLIEGLADLIRGRISLNTLLIFSFLLCCADGILCLQELRVPCCAAFTLQIFLSIFDTLHRRRTEMNQMDALRKASNLTTLRTATESVNGQKVFIRDEGQVEDFMDSYRARSLPEKIRSWYAVGALVAALGVGITGFVLHGLSAGLQIAAVTLLAAVPASFFICLSRPMDILQGRLHKLGTVLCGWKGVATTTGKLVFPLKHEDLFPAGYVKMNGVKFFGTREPDEVVAYGTSLILADRNGLAPLFEQVLESRNCHHLTAHNFRRYDGGIGGEVRGEPVLVGTLPFLRDMGVEIPEGLKVSHAICVAVDGVLSGLFAISYDRTRSAAAGLHTLCAYRGIQPILADGDFLLTHGFLRAKFGAHTKRITIADSDLQSTVSDLEPNPDVPAAVLSTQQDLAALAYGITGARALHTASYLGLIVHMAGGIIGIGIMLTLTLIGALDLLTPLHVMLYQLIWSIPGLLLTEWTRLI